MEAPWYGTGNQDLSIETLGPCRVRSGYYASRYVCDDEKNVFDTRLRVIEESLAEGRVLQAFERAGPREMIYFDPSKTRCGIITCGGLCPGLNNVIRAIVMQLSYQYGVRVIYGFRYGFEGLIPEFGHEPLMLTPDMVTEIHERGGSILGMSRGPQDAGEMTDALERLAIHVLFCLGGDGTLRGAKSIAEEAGRRSLKLAVVGVPKTIDNDIAYIERSFGFETAFSVAVQAIRGAHEEAEAARNGVGLVKLMGRHSGYIAACAAMACRDVNFVLIPEIDFDIEGPNGLLRHLERRLDARRHAVIVVAEGAGEKFFGDEGQCDASGNRRLGDIGVLLRDRIKPYFLERNKEINLKYIDPSYIIRSAPATPNDAVFAGLLGQMAVHAGMAGRTDMLVGYWNQQFTHVPISAAVSVRRTIDPRGNFWQNVVEATGQPRRMVNESVQVAEQAVLAMADAARDSRGTEDEDLPAIP